jgi:hypothetical protein
MGIFLFSSLLLVAQDEGSIARKFLNRYLYSYQHKDFLDSALRADIRRMIDRYVSDAVDFELMRHNFLDFHYREWDRYYSRYRSSRNFDNLISYYLFFNSLQQSKNYEQLLRNYEYLLSGTLENLRAPLPSEKRTETGYLLHSKSSGEYLGAVYINKTGSVVSSVHFFPLSMNALSKAVSELTSAYTDNVEEYYKKDPVKIRIFVEGKEFELIVGGTKTPELRPVLRDKEK